MANSAQRNSAIDPLRMVLALFVIALHTGFPDGLPGLAKQALVNGLYRIAVPIFAVISGYFFMGALRSGRALPYMKRILTLYVLWMLIYLPIYGPDLTSIGHATRLWFFGYFHLWFLPGLLISAALMLLLTRLRMPALAIGLVALVCAAAGLVMQYLVISGRAQLPLDAYRNGLFVIFPYFASGYLLAFANRRGVAGRYGLWLAGLALLAVIAESLIWYWIAGGGFGVDNMLSLLIAAPVVFLVALDMHGPQDGKRIASMAAFVYFSHVMVMIAASHLGLDGNAKAIFVMAVCVSLAWLLNKPASGRVLGAIT